MKKILYLINDLNIGGTENVLFRLVRGLDTTKYQIKIVSILPTGIIGEFFLRLGIEVYSLNSYKFNLKAVVRFYNILKNYKADILHCFLPQSIIFGRFIGNILHTPLIISSYRSNNFGSRLQILAFGITNKWSHINTVVSSDMAASIMEKHITNVKPIIIRNGINIKDYINQNVELRKKCRQELKISETDIIITALGQLREAKGYFDLLNAITILKIKYSNIHYLIIGEGELYSKIQNKIEEYHLGEEVNLLGQKNNPEFYLNASDIYVLSSLWEGFPNALLEAMACGLPPVATKVSGVTEIIQNGQNGFWAEPNNSIDLANKLEKLILMKSEERKNIGLAARQTVEKYYSIKKMVSEYEKLYD